jgi:hypothetical protein
MADETPDPPSSQNDVITIDRLRAAEEYSRRAVSSTLGRYGPGISTMPPKS